MSFIAHLIQAGEGCDYTIDCGKKLVRVNALTEKEAMDELKRMLMEDYSIDELESATLYEVSNVIDAPLDEWLKEKREMERNKELERQRQVDIARMNDLARMHGYKVIKDD